MSVFLDMDGVICDFVGRACEAHGVDNPYPRQSEVIEGVSCEWDICKVFGMEPSKFWGRTNTFSFWEHMPWTEDGRDILQLLESQSRPENIFLLTSPTLAPESAAGKMAWVRREMPDYYRRLIICPCKEVVAAKGQILIDDSDRNCTMWVQAGGTAVLVYRPWNAGYACPAEKILESIAVNLQIIRNGPRKART